MSDSVKPWDLLNPNKPKSPEEIQKSRLDICKKCEYLFTPTNQCKKCGCFMHLKVKLSNAECPIGKW
jgi:uncharacterized paraquat-inducible protein A